MNLRIFKCLHIRICVLFNCFVRPRYDGSHQTFPDLNLKGLASRGIKSVYPSQMDCVWMLKQNGGGICDHEVLRP